MRSGDIVVEPLDDDEKGTWHEPLEVGVLSWLLLAGGVLGFVLAALAPMLSWFALSPDSGKSKPMLRIVVDGWGNVRARPGDDLPADQRATLASRKESLTGADRPDGVWVALFSAVLAALTVAGCGLAFAGVMKRKDRAVLTTTLVIGMVGSVALVVWHIAWLWKVVSLSRVIHDRPMFNGTTAPDVGLYAGIGLGILAAFSVSKLADLHLKRVWIYVSEGLGLVLGGAILVLLVKPWEADHLWTAMLGVLTGLAR